MSQEIKNRSILLFLFVQAILFTFLLTLSQLSGNIQNYFQDNMDQMLGADVVLTQNTPLTASTIEQLGKWNTKVVTTNHQTLVANAGDKWQKLKVKGVKSDYPLKGEVLISNGGVDTTTAAQQMPAAGEIWLDSRAMSALSVSIGQQVFIQSKAFTVTNTLQHEPDRLMETHSVEMRAIANANELSVLSISQENIDYRYLIEVDSKHFDAIEAWYETAYPSGYFISKDKRHPLALFWQRTENVIGITSILLFFMAAIAIWQLTSNIENNEKRFTALLLSFGKSESFCVLFSLIKWLLYLVLVTPISLVLSWLLQGQLIAQLQSTIPGLVASWQTMTFLQTFVLYSSIFILFLIPSWLSVKSASIRALFSDGSSKGYLWLKAILSLVLLSFLALTYTDNPLLTTYLLVSIFSVVIFVVVFSWALLWTVEKLTAKRTGLFAFTVFMMKQRLLVKSTQILGVALSAFLLLFTLSFMHDLGESIEKYQRKHDGNLLVSQANEQQMKAIETAVNSVDGQMLQKKPFVFAKLVRINETKLAESQDKPSESLSTMMREIRMHPTKEIPSNNRVLSGDWQNKQGDWQVVSVEQEVYEDLGLALGDKLTFSINNRLHTFTLEATHGYVSGNGSITFWVNVPETIVSNLQLSPNYMASLNVEESSMSVIDELWQQFPTLRITSMAELTKRFDDTLALLSKLVVSFSSILMLMVLIVVYASVVSTEKAEKQKNALIMSFGFGKQTCSLIYVMEWVLTGAVAAFAAIGGNWIAGSLIYQSQFGLVYQPDMLWILQLLLFILVSVVVTGVMLSRAGLTGSVRTLMSE